MNDFTQKKWFVYLGDHHEGPFSVDEIQQKMAQGIVSAESHVWAEGMPDWKIMTEVPDFQELLSSASKEPPSLPDLSHGVETVAQEPPSLLFQAPTSSESQIEPTVLHAVMEPNPTLEPQTAQEMNAQAQAGSEQAGSDEEKVNSRVSQRSMKGLFQILFCLGLTAGGVFAWTQGYLDPLLKIPMVQTNLESFSEWSRPYLLIASDKIPVLQQWVSPIPHPEDLSQEEFEELRTAARAKLQDGGPRFAMALSKGDGLTPSFYVASNWAEDLNLRLYVIGIPDTLLNQLSFQTQVPVALSKRWGKTDIIHFPDGKPIPRGEFMVYLALAESQGIQSQFQRSIERIPPEIPKDSKIIFTKTFFLGGSRDAVYISRLKEFHDRLRTKANNEIAEIKQFSATLVSQLTSTITKFNLLKKGRLNKKKRKSWEDFHNEWIRFQSHLDQILQRWTPQVVQTEFFYGVLYRLTQQAGQAVERVHGFHHAYFVGLQDPKAFEIQLGEATSAAQSVITVLKAKIEQAEKLAPTPNGMPRRDGL